MTSVYPYSTPQVDISSPIDCCPCCPPIKKILIIGGLLDVINKTPEFSIYKCLLEKSGLNLFDEYYNYTLFIPSNSFLVDYDIDSIDKNIARQLILTSALKESISSDLLKQSKISYYTTLNPVENLLISIEGDLININANSNKSINVISDIVTVNGIIHVVNDLIMPYAI